MAVLVIASCTKNEIQEDRSISAPAITASIHSDSPGVKTSISVDQEGVGTIFWQPGDRVNIFFGTTSVPYTSTNTEPATTVVFNTTAIIGSTESASTNRWGLYPYNENATCDGSSVTTTIPPAQNAVPETFDNETFTMLGHSADNMITFYNVCGGIKFSLGRDDIEKITFKGNNNEDLAGKVKLEMDDEGRPKATVVEGQKTITLTPKTGTTFASGTNYYIITLPVVLSSGFTMTFETATEIGTFNYTEKAVTVARSKFGKKAEIDSYSTFDAKKYVDLGLSVNWATCNLGATSPKEFGGYYQWAGLEDVTSISIYLDYSYVPYHTGSDYDIGWTKYIPSKNSSYWSGSGSPDNKTILDLEDDAAHVFLGADWRMPTIAEWEELKDNCTWTWTENYNDTGVAGQIVTSKKTGYTDKSIFLPATGYRANDQYKYAGSEGFYWSSSLYTHWPSSAYHMHFDKYFDSERGFAYYGRFYGLSMRPVFIDRSAAVSGVNLNKTSLDLTVGVAYTLSATFTPSNAFEKSVTWSSSNTSVATINQNGVVTAVKSGSATITVKTKDGGYTATCDVTVSDPQAVDLGLSVKWASSNLGANSPEDLGGYYQWAGTQDVTEAGSRDSDICPYHSNSDAYNTGWTKYIPSEYSSYWSGSGSPDNKTVLDLEDDAAHVILGGSWRIPTRSEFQELIDNCDAELITLNNVEVRKFTSRKNGCSIFLPINSLFERYWSSSLGTPPHNAYYFQIGWSSTTHSVGPRDQGHQVRPVSE